MEIYGMMGERLGTIGEDSNRLPQWKKDFLSRPSSSIRRGIAWGTQQAYEDTSTLVLTAPSSNFIDVRFPVASRNASETATHASFWAFSGEVSTSFYDASTTQPYSVGLPYTAYSEFVHDIDTRGRGIIDAGDTCLLPNGESLEFGSMVNPTSGREEAYKEYWCSAEPLPHPDGIDDSKVCIVARVASPASVEGTIIRIGGRIQGIISRGNDDNDDKETIEVERWTRDSDKKRQLGGGSDDGTWTRDPRSTGSFLPHYWLIQPGRTVGENFEHAGILWSITEID